MMTVKQVMSKTPMLSYCWLAVPNCRLFDVKYGQHKCGRLYAYCDGALIMLYTLVV